VLLINSTHIVIKNAASNRRKKIPITRAVAVPQPGSFIKSPNGEWHKVGKTKANEVNMQVVKVLPKDMQQTGK